MAANSIPSMLVAAAFAALSLNNNPPTAASSARQPARLAKPAAAPLCKVADYSLRTVQQGFRRVVPNPKAVRIVDATVRQTRLALGQVCR